MEKMSEKIALYCLKAGSERYSEVCEECSQYGKVGCDHCCEDAFEVAIQALENQSMVNEILNELKAYRDAEEQGLLLKLECRCKDCVHVDYAGCTGATVYCMKHEAYMNEDDFCIHAVHEKLKGEEHEID